MSKEIFDKEGNKLNIADIMYDFIKERAESNKKDIRDICVRVDIGFPAGTPIWITTAESVDNGYDATDLIEFGEPLKTNN